MRFRLLESVNPQDVFSLTNTGMSYYDEFLKPNSKNSGNEYMQSAKNLTGKIEYMTPTDYFEHCANDIFSNTSVERLLQQRNDKDTVKYIDDMLKGDKFPLTVLNFAGKSQEGLHRMKAFGDTFGWDTKAPVLCVYVYDQDRENKLMLQRECNDFNRYDLKDCTRYAEERINDEYWDAEEIPSNFTDMWAELVKEYAKTEFDKDIELEVEISEHTSDNSTNHRVDTYMTYYNGYELDYIERCNDNIWMEDLFYSVLNNKGDELDEI